MPFITFEHFRRSSVDLGKIIVDKSFVRALYLNLMLWLTSFTLLGAEGKERKEN